MRWSTVEKVRRLALVPATVGLVVAVVVAGMLAASDRSVRSPAPASPPVRSQALVAEASSPVFPATAGARRFVDARTAVRAFAVELAGFDAPLVGRFDPGADPAVGVVVVRARPQGPATRVDVRRLRSDGSWWVMGARATNVAVASPRPGQVVGPGAPVRGLSREPEGEVDVTVREDGNPKALGRTVVEGGHGWHLDRFRGHVRFRRPAAGSGAIVFTTENFGTGRVEEATVVPVRFAPSP
jgi:hypothetical protein